MSVVRSTSSEDEILKDMFTNPDYNHSKKVADDLAVKFASMLNSVATDMGITFSRVLGTRSVRKQIQALAHYCIGNQKLRVNANTHVPSTAVLRISPTVGP